MQVRVKFRLLLQDSQRLHWESRSIYRTADYVCCLARERERKKQKEIKCSHYSIGHKSTYDCPFDNARLLCL
jgi:NhaP-type Na+/H+ and K+/H+ antiporter